MIKNSVTKIKNNPMAAVAGLAIGWYVAPKMKVENKYARVGIALVSALLFSMASSAYKANQSKPTATTTK